MTTKKSPNKPESFEASLAELDKIVQELERGEISLERSLELYEQGTRLSRECQDRLRDAETRIEALSRDSASQESSELTEDDESDRYEQTQIGSDDDIPF